MKSHFGGGVWPVVQRELRAAARRPFGPWLRMGGAIGGIIALFSGLISEQDSAKFSR
jgi:hypothetical protein